MKLATVSVVSVLLASQLGCGPDVSHLPATVPAEGVVTLDGQPVENAAVMFIADAGNYHATAMTDATGKFSLRAFDQKDGVVPGSYKVEVNKTIVTGGDNASTDGEGAAPNVQFGLPAKYSTVGTSGLTQTIPDAGATDIKIDLKSK
jgi:hypothetical protein